MPRIGVNALYLIPGRVGGTEIYLRNLLDALARIDAVNQYVVFTNRETGADLVPKQANFIAGSAAGARGFSSGENSVGANRTAARGAPPSPRRSVQSRLYCVPRFARARRSPCFTICSTSGIRNTSAGSIYHFGISSCGCRRGDRAA